MLDGHHISGIILMAGNGARFGHHRPKQFHLLSGKKVYLHTLEVFLNLQAFDEILLICPSDHIAEISADIVIYNTPIIKVLAGGKTRQESSFLGLKNCHYHDIVLIHDGVRPFVSHDILLQNIKVATLHGACDTCIPSYDTLICTYDQKIIDHIPLRSDMMRGQTPQTFQYELLLKAHEIALAKGTSEASDDCQLVKVLPHPVYITLGSDHNIKITTEYDFLLAEQLLRRLSALRPTSQPISFKGRIYAITGGSGGIGSALIELLHSLGAQTINLSRSSSLHSVDLTSETKTRSIFEKIQKDYGPLDGLINCVGYLKTSQLSHLSGSDIRKMIATNFTSVVYAYKYCSLKKGAHLLNIASSSFSRGRADYTIYSSMKAAIVNLTQGLALEAPHLFINAAIPSRTNTKMRSANFMDDVKEDLLDPSDVAKRIIEVLKQEITGTLIEIK